MRGWHIQYPACPDTQAGGYVYEVSLYGRDHRTLNGQSKIKKSAKLTKHFQWKAPYDIIKYKVMPTKEVPLWTESLDSYQLFLEMKNPF